MEFIFGYPIWEFKKSDKFDRKKIEQEIYRAEEKDTEDKELGIKSTRGGYPEMNDDAGDNEVEVEDKS